MNINRIVNNPDFLEFLFNDRFILIALVIFLIRIKYATYKNMWLLALVNIFGTFLHELCHFVIGTITNARPIDFEILPKKAGPGFYTMGSVSFENIKYYNAVPSAMAPLLLLPFGFWLNQNLNLLMEPNFKNYILYVLMQTIIIENAIPSRTDFRIAFKYPLGVLLYGILALCILKLGLITISL
ncbi:MAG: hypothetical protein AB7U85_01180 [Alphaproteobacteria bacterium]